MCRKAILKSNQIKCNQYTLFEWEHKPQTGLSQAFLADRSWFSSVYVCLYPHLNPHHQIVISLDIK